MICLSRTVTGRGNIERSEEAGAINDLDRSIIKTNKEIRGSTQRRAFKLLLKAQGMDSVVDPLFVSVACHMG